ncbi:MAG: sulfotransferase family protein [Prochlorotrichaceae cyanobacterium]|jgi:hypothetical protein
MKKPNFFIVGAPKCGTTALFTYLGEHPEIYTPYLPDSLEALQGGKKELNFFGSDLDFGRPSLAEYLRYYEAADQEAHLGESSVFYLASHTAASEIYQFCPEARILMMLRNPVDMMYSWHSQLLFWGDENIETFGEALAAEPQRRKGENLPARRDHPSPCYLYRDIARYTEQIQRYFKVFKQEQIQIIIFDDFKANPQAVYHSVLEFLGCQDQTFEPNFAVVNANKTIRNRGLQQLLRHQPGFVRSLKTLVPPFLRKNMRKTIEDYNTKSESRQPLSAELQSQLKQEFKVEVEALSQLLNRDLTHWTSP